MDALVVNLDAVRRAVHQHGRVGNPAQRQQVVEAVIAENRAGRTGMAVAGALQLQAIQQRGRPAPGGAA